MVSFLSSAASLSDQAICHPPSFPFCRHQLLLRRSARHAGWPQVPPHAKRLCTPADSIVRNTAFHHAKGVENQACAIREVQRCVRILAVRSPHDSILQEPYFDHLEGVEIVSPLATSPTVDWPGNAVAAEIRKMAANSKNACAFNRSTVCFGPFDQMPRRAQTKKEAAAWLRGSLAHPFRAPVPMAPVFVDIPADLGAAGWCFQSRKNPSIARPDGRQNRPARWRRFSQRVGP